MDWFKWFRRRTPVVAQPEPPGTATLELARVLRPSSYVPPMPVLARTASAAPPAADKTPTSLTTADGTTRIVLQRFPAQHRAVLLPLALAVVEADRQLPAGMVQKVVLDTLVALASQKSRGGGCRNGRCRRTVTKRENPPA